ncbi:MAG: immune inhibitor A [Anaerolineales bacterium]|nr:immune inhibitor A [Anaerolineales bacterium]
MLRRSIYILAILAMMLGVVPAPAMANPVAQAGDPIPVDAPAELRNWKATPDRIAPVDAKEMTMMLEQARAIANASPDDCITDTKYFLVLDDYQGRYLIKTFNLMASGSIAQIWVQSDLSWPSGDPRPAPVVTCDQANYMLGEFENNMYPKETSFFGMPDEHDGSLAYLPGLIGLDDDYYYDESGRQIVLVSNVRDDNYYDPSYPIYIAGFYSPSFEIYFDRNVMTIDAYDWENRTGPNGTRPYLYEGVFAHEYQHLLHDDYDPDEETFINEGMADLAMDIVGYGATSGHLRDAAEYPENSLVAWGDQGDLEILSDYGQAYLFQLYLMEKFGSTFTQALFHNPENGISGVNSTLADFNIQRTFADIFRDWSVALLIDSPIPADWRYGFKSVNFRLNVGTPVAPNPEAYDTPGAPPWGTDYVWLTPSKLNKKYQFKFNGEDVTSYPTAWSSDGEVLWGGEGDLVDHWAIFSATGGGVLSFDTKYDIEEAWDFGFVQVSTDGGATWTSLSNAYTTSDHDPNAHPKVVENLPGLTGSTGGSWVNMSFDLSAYSGQQILIAFRYITDWATYEAGWFIDNVAIDGVMISDGSSVDPFQDITQIVPIENDFMVTFVAIKNGTGKRSYKVMTMSLSDLNEEGSVKLTKLFKYSKYVVMLVTYAAPEGVYNYANYTYEFVK